MARLGELFLSKKKSFGGNWDSRVIVASHWLSHDSLPLAGRLERKRWELSSCWAVKQLNQYCVGLFQWAGGLVGVEGMRASAAGPLTPCQ